jgi:hypothetical protein
MEKKWKICGAQHVGSRPRCIIIPTQDLEGSSSQGLTRCANLGASRTAFWVRARNYSAALTTTLAMASSTDGRSMAKIDCGLTTE